MIKPLSENPQHVHYLCSRLALGMPNLTLPRVYGGFHHKMWRLGTDSGTYAVKQLSSDTDINSQVIINHYNATEAAAEIFSSHGISALFALKSSDDYLHVIEQTGYLVYPWSDAASLDKSAVSEHRAMKIAAVLAKMHLANIKVPGMQEPQFDIISENKVTEVINSACNQNMDAAGTLAEELPSFLNIVNAHKAAIPILEKHVVISHGDLDQKNVLWDTMGNPVLIDWESAKKLNPTCELLLEALDWSGIASTFNVVLFKKIIAAYKQAGGVIKNDVLPASFDCILGDWLNWLIYNVARSVDELEPEQCTLGTEQVNFVLPTILRLKQRRAELLGILEQGLEVCNDSLELNDSLERNNSPVRLSNI